MCESSSSGSSGVVEIYQPGAIVLQCGADSLAHDR